jgi:hypothetical protein
MPKGCHFRAGRTRGPGPSSLERGDRRFDTEPCKASQQALRPAGPADVEEVIMRRKTFDALLATGGLLVAIVLLVAGGLLTWAHSFVNDQVHSQLAAQQIYFPPKGNEALADPAIGPYLNQYAGQQLTNGGQAQAYADHFIKVHLQKIGGGETYAQLSAKSNANPSDTALAGKVQTMFRGETLRGLLLNAFAFWKMGQIAMIAAIVSFVGAGVLLLLAGLGYLHLRRVSPDAEVLPKLGNRSHPPVPVR